MWSIAGECQTQAAEVLDLVREEESVPWFHA